MITLCDVKEFYKKDIALAHIHSLNTAFGGSVLAPDIWVQNVNGEICAVIGRDSARLYIYSNEKETAELKAFINTVGFGEVFCSSSTAKCLGLNPKIEFSVLVKEQNGTLRKSPEGPLKELYSGLLEGSDGDIDLPEFSAFAPNISHRLRHNGAAAILNDIGAGVIFKFPFGGIVNGIAVKNNLRGKGLGSALLSELLEFTNGDIFVCATNKNINFYIKNGFKVIDTAVIAR